MSHKVSLERVEAVYGIDIALADCVRELSALVTAVHEHDHDEQFRAVERRIKHEIHKIARDAKSERRSIES
ncbi:MAG: hypothetical protein GF350_12405 [Chitinivibrionales bacterium]|nr:hypothetical protein [Chitinivibrionales bacterium]